MSPIYVQLLLFLFVLTEFICKTDSFGVLSEAYEKQERAVDNTYTYNNNINYEIDTSNKPIMAAASWINGTINGIVYQNLSALLPNPIREAKPKIIVYKPGFILRYTCAHSYDVEGTQIIWTHTKGSENIIVAGPILNTRRLDIQMTFYEFDDDSRLTCYILYQSPGPQENNLKAFHRVFLQLDENYVKRPVINITIVRYLGGNMVNPYEYCSDQAATVRAFYANNTHANISLIIDSVITEEYNQMLFVCITIKPDISSNLITRLVENIIVLSITIEVKKNDSDLGIYPTKDIELKDVLIICAIILILIITSVAILYAYMKRKKKRQIAIESAYAEVNYYNNPMQSRAQPGVVVYAEIHHPKQSGVKTLTEKTPYAQIIGVMEPKKKRNVFTN